MFYEKNQKLFPASLKMVVNDIGIKKTAILFELPISLVENSVKDSDFLLSGKDRERIKKAFIDNFFETKKLLHLGKTLNMIAKGLRGKDI